jgi:TP901 family phage tail tape measure protein
MTDINVALKLRLDYQKRGADEAERDLKDIKRAADQIGRSRGGEELNQDIRAIGRSADDAKQKIAAIGTGFNSVAGEAKEAANAIGRIKAEADQARTAVAAIDNGAFNGLKSDAASAKAAIAEIGAAADAAQNKIRQMKPGYSTMTTPGGRLVADGHWRPGGGMMSTAEGALDQFGLPLAVGAGGAYLAGAIPAGLSVAGGAAVRAAANDEFRLDQIQNIGGFNDEERKRYDQLLGAIGPKYGVGKPGAMDAFGSLLAGGLNHSDAAVMTEGVLKFAKASDSGVGDAASMATALRNNMKINPKDLPGVYDSIIVGGNAGQFEVGDMARNFPSMLAAMAVQGSTGGRGVNLAAAMAQSIRDRSGNSDQAKTSFEAMLRDMAAPEVTDRAKKDYGVDFFAIQAAAAKEGQDPVLAAIKAYRKAVGGKPEKMRDLFRNDESFKGLSAIFEDLEKVEALMAKMDEARGTTDGQYDGATDNLNSQGARLTSNVGQNLKDAAAPLLPFLTSAARAISEAIEQTREKQQNDPLAVAPSGGMIQEGMRLWLEHTAPNRKEPSTIDRFLWGKAADPDFNAREHFGNSLRPTAQTSMEGYRQGLAEEGAKAEQEAQSIADRIKALLGFTVSPVISPTYVPPGGAPSSPAPGQQSSLSPANINQTINSPNAMHAGRQSARNIQRAQARSLYDTGRRFA